MVFVYVTGIMNENDAKWAVSRNASAIGVSLSYKQGALQAEAVRELFLQLPKGILRAGIFCREPLHHVFELATFCGLDILHFVNTPAAEALSEGQQVFFESWDETAGDVLIRPLASYRQALELPGDAKAMLVTGDFSLSEWREILLHRTPYGIMLDRNQKNCEEVLTWLKNQSLPLTGLREQGKAQSQKQ